MYISAKPDQLNVFVNTGRISGFLANPVHTGDRVEFNTVDFVESRLLLKLATNRQQSRLLPYTFNFVAGFCNKSATA